jgi:hypothetical protein
VTGRRSGELPDSAAWAYRQAGREFEHRPRGSAHLP